MKSLIIALSIGLAALLAYWINHAIPSLDPSDNAYAATDAASASTSSASAIDWSQGGAALFKANCSRCHSTKLEKPLTGPALYKVEERMPGGDWIYQWIANSQELIKSGNAYAVKIYEENNKAQMDPFPNLTREEVDLIMAFIASYTPS